MKTRRKPRRFSVIALAAVLVALVLGLAAPAFGSSSAAQRQIDRVAAKAERQAQQSALLVAVNAQKNVQRQVIVEFGDPVNIARDDRVETVVSIGGDVTVAGTVDTTVVAVGGDVTLLPTAKVGPANGDEASIVVINGELTRAAGAQVSGGVADGRRRQRRRPGELGRGLGTWRHVPPPRDLRRLAHRDGRLPADGTHRSRAPARPDPFDRAACRDASGCFARLGRLDRVPDPAGPHRAGHRSLGCCW